MGYMMEKDYNHRDEIELALQAALEGYSPKADAVVWDNIEAVLHRKEKKRAVYWWLKGAAAASVAAAVVLAYFVAPPHTQRDTHTVKTYRPGSQAPHGEPTPATTAPSENSVAAGEERLEKTTPAEGGSGENMETTPAGAATVSSFETAHTATDRHRVVQAPGNDIVPPSTQAIEAASLEKMSLLALPGPFAGDPREPEVKKRFFPIDPSEYAVPGDQGGSWELAANFSSAGSQSSAASASQSNSLRGDVFLANEKQSEAGMQKVTYHAPVIIGLRGGIDLGARLSLESGISYTLLPSSSEGQTPAGEQIDYRTELHYLGVPLLLNYRFVMKKRFDVYCTQGLTLDKGIAGRRISITGQSDPATRRFTNIGAPGLQGAIVFGAGVDYHISKIISLYFQPTVSSWLLNLGQGPNGRNQQLAWPSLQVGVRFHP